jgi:DNA-binding transcriptional MerR regulator
MKTKKPVKPYLNPFEQITDLGKDTLVTAVKEVAKTVNPLAELFVNPTAQERATGNNNFSELDFDKLNKQYSKQDNPNLEAIRAQLKGGSNGENETPQEVQDEQLKAHYHKRVQRDEEEENLKEEQEEQEEERQEALEEQQKAEAEAAANAAPLQAPKGKVLKNILGGKGNMKASTELPPELKAAAGRG